MAEEVGPHDLGKHALGPHVVGQRVVVRRLLRDRTGPSGGPAYTDVLGVCVSWADGVCVVQRDSGGPAGSDGESVHIATADIVSGKPVPPRPSPRHRVPAQEAQLRALALWPRLETRPLGDWLLRHSPGTTARRANSVLAMAPSGVADDYAQVLDFYAGRTGRPIAAVLPDSAEDQLFRSHGWVAESHDADTLFQMAGVAQVRRALRAARPAEPTDPAELEEDGDLVTLRFGDRARGVAAYERDWVGFRGIEVAPEHRRQGLGLAVLAALLEWGAERGATTTYLQVLGDNEPALALYERLGFTTHHAYRYLAPSA
ncbi:MULTISPECIES: GNAT family N-acetyltransferase [unclassified Nocardioides]|uniref:GNAT family N-acetyltransferase n=1 Tax=unclassified Nocardioides TaxID=2615069 RepID=UPI000325C237|nr:MULTISPECIES: GNAT family N-acetyltransferase [unclassified Nocardioides]